MDNPPVLALAESWAQFRQIRRLRNECREYMTHNQDEITVWRQFGFWLYHQTLGYRAYLLSDKGKPVAYGLIRRDATGFDWISGGVAAQERGKGYGKMMFGFLTVMAAKPAYLDVFWTNGPARSLYRKLGWIEFERVDTALGTLIVMVNDGIAGRELPEDRTAGITTMPLDPRPSPTEFRDSFPDSLVVMSRQMCPTMEDHLGL